ncbi:hypothetical protein [Butyrivibrio sp. AE2032]|uniref:hypothetical protein n=1 Tax=Butyrivibrio sp. AE2032 TaxID=1458463 RepID=UPI00054F24AF|nr:hypothetical protein [Butyrivibrio sp. AE2032]
MELTKEEKNVLSGITFHTEEIEKGELCEADMELLKEMRAVAGYFKEKYPSYTFEITGCEPKSGTVREHNEWYYKVAGLDRASAFIATAEEKDGKFEIRDDFFGEIIKDEMADEIKKILTKNSFPVVKVTVGFWESLGSQHGEDISASDVLKGVIRAGNDIKIFLDGSKLDCKKYEDVSASVEKALLTEKIKGDVYIVVVKDSEGDLTKDRLFSDTLYLE